MNSNELFMYLAPRCLIVTLVVNCLIVGWYTIKHKRRLKTKEFWWSAKILVIVMDTFVAFTLFMIVFFVPNSVISGFLPTITKYETKVLSPEIIKEENIIEHENIIEIPSIILPLNPEGREAVVIDTSSEELRDFMYDFYGENVEFFNNREEATYLSNSNGFVNYTGIDLGQIVYKEEAVTSVVSLDKLGYDTIWLFTDFKNIKLEPMKCKVVVYSPHSISQKEIDEIKLLGNVTIITVEDIK